MSRAEPSYHRSGTGLMQHRLPINSFAIPILYFHTQIIETLFRPTRIFPITIAITITITVGPSESSSSRTYCAKSLQNHVPVPISDSSTFLLPCIPTFPLCSLPHSRLCAICVVLLYCRRPRIGALRKRKRPTKSRCVSNECTDIEQLPEPSGRRKQYISR